VIIWLSYYFSFNCRNSYLGFDGMFMYVNWMIIVLLMMNLHAKSHICGYVMFLWKLMKNEVVVVELWVNSWLFVVDVVLDHVVDELISWVSLFVNWGWELLLLLKNCESLVNCWILMKRCFNPKFYASLSVFSCIWLVNIIWDEFWVGKDQNWDFWGKGVWNPKIFYLTDECSLERAPSERA